jgi:hypothetical protein
MCYLHVVIGAAFVSRCSCNKRGEGDGTIRGSTKLGCAFARAIAIMDDVPNAYRVVVESIALPQHHSGQADKVLGP